MTETTKGYALIEAKRRIRVGALLKNALSLMLSTGGTASLGVVFWGLATHLADAANVAHPGPHPDISGRAGGSLLLPLLRRGRPRAAGLR